MESHDAVGPAPGQTLTTQDLVPRVRRRRLDDLLGRAPDGFVLVDAVGRVREWSTAAEQLLHLGRRDALDAAARDLIIEHGRREFDRTWAELARGSAGASAIVVVETHGHTRAVHVSAVPIQADGRFAGVVATLRAARTGSSAPSAPPAPGTEDVHAVTAVGPVERPQWPELRERLALPVAPGTRRAVCALEIDALPLVTQAYGGDAAQAVRAELVRRVSGGDGPAAAAGRWYGETLVWVLDAADPARVLEELSHVALEAAREPFAIDGDLLRLPASVGLASGTSTADGGLLASVMGALEAAKSSNRDRVVWSAHASAAASAPDDGTALARGIENGELRLHFQPIIELAGDTLDGVEALVRWQRPDAALLHPASFVEIAERTGDILALGTWVTRAACAAAVALRPGGATPFSMSINVSAVQLADPGLVRLISAALDESHCPPESLIVEITETAVLEDLGEAVATLSALKDLGVRIDLDDFGTGYSSLAYLRAFPVDRIKIDHSFVSGLGTNHADTTIVASTIALAHAMGVLVVAEGVETTAQLDLLRHLGCDYVQGYLVSRPVDAQAFAAWRTNRPDAPAADVPRQNSPATPRAAATVGRESTADRRERIADQRETLADQRDALADEREHRADERDHRVVEVGADTSDSARLERGEAALGRARDATARSRAREALPHGRGGARSAPPGQTRPPAH
jgi:PAS domain S-box-containing protein